MLTRRIIPCLDVDGGRVVKGVRFASLRDAGDPAELAARYADEGADEVVILDISATAESRRTAADTVAHVRRALSIPLTVGGGIASIEDASRLLDAGADRVSLNTAAVRRPELIADTAGQFGSQCVVVAIDAARDRTNGNQWSVLTRSGRDASGLCAVYWARLAARLGAGEILLTSWDRDGTHDGYDLELIQAVSNAVPIPVIASGGAGAPPDLLAALRAGADAVLAASIFHDGRWSIRAVKEFLNANRTEVRL